MKFIFPFLLTTSQRAMIVEIDSSMIVSTMEPASFMLFSVYPNPASETVHIQCSASGEPIEIHIYDMVGKEWFTQNIPKSAQVETLDVDVQNWPPGVNLVSLVCGVQQVIRRVVVS